MAKINEIDITSLLFQEGAAPATPASTKWRLYTKTDGLYVIDDAGVETGPLGTGGGGGGTSSLTSIAKTTLASDTATIVFSSIPSTYDELLLRGRVRTNRASTLGGTRVRVGAGTVESAGTNYFSGSLRRGSSSGSATVAGGTGWDTVLGCGDSALAGTFGDFHMQIRDYAVAGRHALQRHQGSHLTDTAMNWWTIEGGGRWANTSDAIDIIELSAWDGGTEFKSGTEVELVGVTYV